TIAKVFLFLSDNVFLIMRLSILTLAIGTGITVFGLAWDLAQASFWWVTPFLRIVLSTSAGLFAAGVFFDVFFGGVNNQVVRGASRKDDEAARIIERLKKRHD